MECQSSFLGLNHKRAKWEREESHFNGTFAPLRAVYARREKKGLPNQFSDQKNCWELGMVMKPVPKSKSANIIFEEDLNKQSLPVKNVHVLDAVTDVDECKKHDLDCSIRGVFWRADSLLAKMTWQDSNQCTGAANRSGQYRNIRFVEMLGGWEALECLSTGKKLPIACCAGQVEAARAADMAVVRQFQARSEPVVHAHLNVDPELWPQVAKHLHLPVAPHLEWPDHPAQQQGTAAMGMLDDDDMP